jgi:UPF0042 nucleotide-binding protein
MADYAIITGLSGAGRSQAGANLEDQGWFVIDNLPIALITKVAELVAGPTSRTSRIALVVGRDVGQLSDLKDTVAQLRSAGHTVRVLFLEASDEVLVRRYEGTRRPHPLGDEAVTDAIAHERRTLEPVRELADIIIDTSALNVHELRDRLGKLFGGDGRPMQVSVLSFGFKHGVPLDVDNLFDCRFLPNPHWDEELRPLTGLDGEVRDFVLGNPAAQELIDRIDGLLQLVIPASLEEGKAYCTVAVGCTGGHHRSVVIAEELARRIADRGFRPSVHHRDIDR